MREAIESAAPCRRQGGTGVLRVLQHLQISEDEVFYGDRASRQAAPLTDPFTRLRRALLLPDPPRRLQGFPKTAPDPSKTPPEPHLGALQPHLESHLRHLRPSWRQDRLKTLT